jgi:hypothetical protein
MLATYAASRHRHIVPCCMISSVSHDNVSRLVTDRSTCFATALDKAFENIDCMSAILRCQQRIAFMNQLNALSNRVEYYGFCHLGERI